MSAATAQRQEEARKAAIEAEAQREAALAAELEREARGVPARVLRPRRGRPKPTHANDGAPPSWGGHEKAANPG